MDAGLTWTLDKRPLIVFLFWTETSIKHHFIRVHANCLHWASWWSFQALPFSSVTGIVTPSAPRLFQTLSTRPQSRAVLSCITWNIILMQEGVWVCCFFSKWDARILQSQFYISISFCILKISVVRVSAFSLKVVLLQRSWSAPQYNNKDFKSIKIRRHNNITHLH